MFSLSTARSRTYGAAAILLAALAAALPAPAAPAELDAIAKAAAEYHGGSVDTGQIYSQCLLSTVRNDLTFTPDGTTYVITGDIGAMWLRDASAQVRPYLYFAADPAVKSMLRGVITREAKNIAVDPYANAFNRDYQVTEEKFELDSLLYPIQLAWMYWKQTGDAGVFTPDVKASYEKALAVMELERDHSQSRYRHAQLPNDGAGNPVGYTGMIWTGFRPSDDAALYGYHIPDEMFAVVVLTELSELEGVVWHDEVKQQEVEALRDGVNTGIDTYGITYSPKWGYIYAYEVDGLGHTNLMDDANVPSLLSIPYLGYGSADNPIYQNTRKFVLSADDPFFFSGKIAEGVGSPHTPPGYIWPLALDMEGLTSTDPAEVAAVLTELRSSDLGDHLLHESFDVDDPTKFTRSNFGWPCSLYSELVLDRVMGDQPLPLATFSNEGEQAAMR
ncbi:MAG TPA: glycoside hydrolase family 125 protein [Candidatus Eremiobacteraceae bacterium]|nr:glycoside hydrolase family 125 protein [Candidatus Eremiobacteraceae bacterium]